jgi:hypothetical protein
VRQPDPIFTYALWTGLTAVTITAFLAVMIVFLRGRSLVSQRRRQAFIDRWRDVLLMSIDHVPATFPKIPRRYRSTFLKHWNYVQESLRGEVQQNLTEVLRRTGMDRYASRLLDSRFMWRQLLGIKTVGYFADANIYAKLERLAMRDHPVLSLAALRSLVQLEPRRAAAFILRELPTRPTWAPTKVAALLNEAGASVVCHELALHIRTGTVKEKLIYFPYALSTRCLEAVAEIRQVLTQPIFGASEEETVLIIASGLRVLDSYEDRDLIRSFLAHPSEKVRMEAVAALSRVATDEDLPALEAALGDDEWWVRYRAAQGIFANPYADDELIAIIRQKHQQDERIQLVLDHVATEQK